MCFLVFERSMRPWQSNDFIFYKTNTGKEHNKTLKILHDFTRKVINERNNEFEKNNFEMNKRKAFLDMLLKAKHDDSSITFEDIQEEVDTFMFEGHDTTTSATSWACHLIGSHPIVQRKLHQEIDNVFGDSERRLTNDDLNELKYLECVIKESLRLFPPVPFLGRQISEEIKIEGYTIPKGAMGNIWTFAVHRDERYFPDAEKFDPDRFLPENSKNRPPHAFIPFSAGRRNCIGQRFALMEEKIILATLLRRFNIKSLRTTEELECQLELITKPANGIPVELTIREISK